MYKHKKTIVINKCWLFTDLWVGGWWTDSRHKRKNYKMSVSFYIIIVLMFFFSWRDYYTEKYGVLHFLQMHYWCFCLVSKKWYQLIQYYTHVYRCIIVIKFDSLPLKFFWQQLLKGIPANFISVQRGLNCFSYRVTRLDQSDFGFNVRASEYSHSNGSAHFPPICELVGKFVTSFQLSH